eukprot:g6186.t1
MQLLYCCISLLLLSNIFLSCYCQPATSCTKYNASVPTSCNLGCYKFDDTCKLCTVGYYCNDGIKEYPCSPGSYSKNADEGANHTTGSTKESEECQVCNAGYYCPGTSAGKINKQPCSQGKFGNIEGASEKNVACNESCPLGKFGNVPGKTEVTAACPSLCPAGTYGVKEGMTSAADACGTCKVGHYCLGDGKPPVPCPEGKYGNISGGTNLHNACSQLCPLGRFGNVPGKTEVTAACPNKCSAGKFGVQRGEKDESSACRDCEMGHYCRDGINESPCGVGTFGNVTGQSDAPAACPSKCPTGRWGNSTGRSQLTGQIDKDKACANYCPAGKYGAMPGTVSEEYGCTLCEAGFYCPGTKIHTKPIPCPAGKYGDENDGNGKSDEPSACGHECPTGRYGYLVGQTSKELACNKFCNVSEYGVMEGGTNESDACKPCPPGNSCPGNINPPIKCKAGRWGNIPKQGYPEKACPNECPKGRYSNETLEGKTSIDTACPYYCKATTYGFRSGQLSSKLACAKCTAGSYCPGSETNPEDIVPCSQGKFGNIEGASEKNVACNESCPLGKFGNVPGKTEVTAACPSLCPAGTYGVKEGMTSAADACGTCKVGHYCLGDGKPPVPCPGGRFGNVAMGNSTRYACPGRCPLGRYSDASLVAKINMDTACPYYCTKGSYGAKMAEINANLACETCPGGSYCPGPSEPVPTIYPEYQSWAPRKLCQTGIWGDIRNKSNEAEACPNKCPHGVYGKKIGSTTEVDACNSTCPSGKYGTKKQGAKSKEGACQNCGSGHYCTGTTVVHGTEYDNRHACGPGRYGDPNVVNASTKQEGCKNFCEKGRYGGTALIGFDNESAACKFFCPPSTYGVMDGAYNESSACGLCRPGFFCIGGINEPQPCGPGKFGNKPGQKNETFACAKECIPGRYGSDTGKTTLDLACPNDCIPGRYGGNKLGAKVYTDCPLCPRGACNGLCSVGKYGSTEGMISDDLACTICPPGKYGTEEGISSKLHACADCEAGLYCPGGSVHKKCPAGKYGNIASQSNESDACPGKCPPGRFSDEALVGQTDEAIACPGKCPKGKFGNISGQISEKAECTFFCPGGMYGDVQGKGDQNSACKTCENGYYCEGGAAKEMCPQGRFSGIPQPKLADSIMNGCPNICKNGSYGTMDRVGKTVFEEACVWCETGNYCYNAETFKCPSGRYGNIPRQPSLILGCPNKCSKGRYGTNQGYTTDESACPETCSPGTYGIIAGATSYKESCGICKAGKYCGGGVNAVIIDGKAVTLSPKLCPAGKYGDETGKSIEAEACPARCAPGTFGNVEGGTNATYSCPGICPAGRFGRDSGKTEEFNACLDCPRGYFCTGGSIENKKACPGGTYGPYPKQKTLQVACNKTCSIGRYGNFPGQYDPNIACPNVCDAGKYGIKKEHTYPSSKMSSCNYCEPGYYCSKDDELKPPQRQECPSGRFATDALDVRDTMEKSCANKCPLGKFGDATGQIYEDQACPKKCANGTHGHIAGQTTQIKACKDCDTGKYQDQAGQPRCKECPEGKYQNNRKQITCIQCTSQAENHKACNDHGTCDPKTGQCRCTPGTGWIEYPPENACSRCLASLWKGTYCRNCRDDVISWHDSDGVLQCHKPCANDEKWFNSKTGKCEEKLLNKALDAMKWVVSILSGMVLAYKIYLYYTLNKEGKLRSGYKNNIKGFIAVLGTRTSSIFSSSSSLGSVLDELLQGEHDGNNSEDSSEDSYEEYGHKNSYQTNRHRGSLIEMNSNMEGTSSNEDADEGAPTSLKNVLTDLNYEQYEDGFIEAGCNDLEQAMYLDLEDLVDDIGMKKLHAKQFMRYLSEFE